MDLKVVPKYGDLALEYGHVGMSRTNAHSNESAQQKEVSRAHTDVGTHVLEHSPEYNHQRTLTA